MGTVLTITAELLQSRMNLVHVSKRSVTTISVGGHTYCPASFQRLSAVIKGGKQDCMYSRKLSSTAVYLWHGAVHAAKAVGLCIVVVVSPPKEMSAVTLGALLCSPIIDMIVHLLTSVVACVCLTFVLHWPFVMCTRLCLS
ncbi:hypothetical protein NP493_2177g00005 [Ridgeia piscesae]|uniref:Uncharacterized protein n=1 Tax=Ridgeia piscesae TaxID=27915 RepID=A0AAD9N3X1_RIDPI|nr:hypothetical protein NP493_2177g00005 [Ridgeia piscesae]